MNRQAGGVRLGVVLYRNSRRELSRLVASLGLNRRSPGVPPFEVMWLDNSPDASLGAVLAELDPGADYRPSGGNLGFGVAHNQMMARAFAEPGVGHYVCVNPDAVLHPDCIRELVAEAGRHPRTGLVEARMFPDEHPKPYHPVSHETPWCSGCVLLITRALYESERGFDERFFMYCEDVDLSWRARAAGFSTHVAPAALAHHYTVTREVSPRREQSVRRSGALLGAKYGNAAFARACLQQYAELGGPPFPEPALERPSRALARVADFSHRLDFAGARW
ncbi:glycosyltransferase family 2 protein [Vitiosangium sp. GDMCC 1.1324]|uniref:glycosyltransferase family 2 protein n=1 Tax=Vitiosangium sp. (strain GDMCC 1.1324) TaxID=2138576 RepID=UPI000D35B721|nr:glycosyltransferase family 2 protein [Vitiosangium sp. GDMCC 1.1324]PTL76165.1 glycosyltransferase family 2 protein [Vitiosangium sp. GDMCC 1.1324]